MPRSAHAVASVLVLALPLLAVTGCGPDDIEAGCKEGSCTVHARSGTSIKIQNFELEVKEVSESSVRLSSHGVSLKLSRELDLRLGSHRLHLVGTGGGKDGGTADIEIK